MKVKIFVLIGMVALVTLSFTFSSPSSSENKSEAPKTASATNHDIGFISDEVVK